MRDATVQAPYIVLGAEAEAEAEAEEGWTDEPGGTSVDAAAAEAAEAAEAAAGSALALMGTSLMDMGRNVLLALENSGKTCRI
jgi:hypothetical protein